MRRVVVLLLVLLGACAGGPREADREPSPLPPPRLENAEILDLARNAGAAASTSLMATVGMGPIGSFRCSNLIPWRDLASIDDEALYRAFGRGLGVDVISGIASLSLHVDVLCFAHRAVGGAASVEYSFDFLLLGTDESNPWTRCYVATKVGGKGDLPTQELGLHDLDVYAAQAAATICGFLRRDGLDDVYVVPTSRASVTFAVAVAFEGRVRQALIDRGVALTGGAKAKRWLELEVNLVRPKDPTIAVACDFNARLSRRDSTIPADTWTQIKTR